MIAEFIYEENNFCYFDCGLGIVLGFPKSECD